ncbi:MAG: glycoside hydrolase family 2 protein [Pseudomonadota bacterium]
MPHIDLSGAWRLRDAAGEHEAEIALPGDAISALFEAGVIPDPYWGRNEYKCGWIAERDWTMTRKFDLETTDFDLVLDQVDTVAQVRINGTLVMDANNAFRRYRVDASHALKVGTNEIEIAFPSSVRVAAERQAAQPFFVPFRAENSRIPNPNMLRKPQCDYGWDWNIALAPFGIYGDMRLEPKEALRIERLAVSQSHGAERASVTVTVHVVGDGLGDLEVTFDGERRSFNLAGPGPATATFGVIDPKLWWPNGQGEQPLYTLTATLGSQTETRRIGLREITLQHDLDEVGARFTIEVNGRPVFAKGANWIPADALPGRVTTEKTRDLLQSAADANMNMIRIWGGGRYEPNWFYEICDELGLMVWQDFMFACALYPSDDDFLSEVEGEVRETVARLHHHPCLALWCGDNENVGALGWFEESLRDRDRYLAAYDRLNYAIERSLKETDPAANWWPSSPSRGRLDFGDGWHDDTSGDMHFWSVWHEGRDFDHYRDVAPRFCSEFGFQSYPSIDQIRSFAAPKDFNIAAPVFESHQKNPGGNARIAETMFRYFRFPEGFENFVYLSQVQQALAIKTAVTHWRSLKPRCQGALIWQLNDTWPVCSWSSLDYGGGWKLLHHAAKAFFAPTLATIVPKEESFELIAVHDGPGPEDLEFKVSALSMEGGERPLEGGSIEVAPGAAKLLACMPNGAIQPEEILLYRWRTPSADWSTDHHAPLPYKAYELPDPGLETRAEGDALTLSTQRPAFFVALEASVPGRFTRNGVLVLPEEPFRIDFHPRDPDATSTFTLRDLYSATYAQTARQGANP